MASPSASGPETQRVHLHVVDAYPEIAVVLLCATRDRSAVEAAVRTLGDVARTVGGLEHGGELLRRSVQQAEHRTLFVVCKTDALDSVAVRRAVESFGARSAAGHRLLVLELVPARAAGFVGTVRRARDQLGRARDAGTAAPIGMRDSSVAESVEGETHVDHALARVDLTASRDAADGKTFARDHVGPIPPYVRTPVHSGRPALVVVDLEREHRDVDSTESDAELISPERPLVAANSAPRLRRARFDRRAIRLAMAVAAGLASAAVIVFGG
jgi:hypothetical protein